MPFRRFRPDGNVQDARNFFLSAKKPSEVTYCIDWHNVMEPWKQSKI